MILSQLARPIFSVKSLLESIVIFTLFYFFAIRLEMVAGELATFEFQHLRYVLERKPLLD